MDLFRKGVANDHAADVEDRVHEVGVKGIDGLLPDAVSIGLRFDQDLLDFGLSFAKQIRPFLFRLFSGQSDGVGAFLLQPGKPLVQLGTIHGNCLALTLQLSDDALFFLSAPADRARDGLEKEPIEQPSQNTKIDDLKDHRCHV
jgi:hypothetical protein